MINCLYFVYSPHANNKICSKRSTTTTRTEIPPPPHSQPPLSPIATTHPFVSSSHTLQHAHTHTHTYRYCNMAYIADQLFPPIATIEESAEFSNFNYWREPVFELDDLVPQDVLDGCIVVNGTTATATVAVDLNVSAASTAASASTPASSFLSAEQATSSEPAINESHGDSGGGSPSQHSSNKSLPTIPEYHKV